MCHSRYLCGDVIFRDSSCLLRRPPASRAFSALHSLSIRSMSPLKTLIDCFGAAGAAAGASDSAGSRDAVACSPPAYARPTKDNLETSSMCASMELQGPHWHGKAIGSSDSGAHVNHATQLPHLAQHAPVLLTVTGPLPSKHRGLTLSGERVAVASHSRPSANGGSCTCRGCDRGGTVQARLPLRRPRPGAALAARSPRAGAAVRARLRRLLRPLTGRDHLRQS